MENDLKTILGLDLGTNSIGWSLIESDFTNKRGTIIGMGSRIIPMSQDILGKFDSGVSISQTAERTGFRGVRRLYQRDNLRRERLHRVLNILGFLPEHYKESIDFKNHYGQFKNGTEVKINYRKNGNKKYEFIFKNSFLEMVDEFKATHPELFYKNKKGEETKIPYDWTIYYLRKKALTNRIDKEELAWLILNFNQKRGYYQLRGEDDETSTDGKKKEFVVLTVKEVVDSGEVIKKSGDKLYDVIFDNGWTYDKQVVKTENWIGKKKEFIVTTSVKKDGEIKRTFKAVNSEEDWIAIKEKTQQEIEKSDMTVGQYIYESILKNPKQKIRGKLVKTIERRFYKDEFKLILKEQIKHHPELQSKDYYKACVEELYPRNEMHQSLIMNKNFEYLFTDDIIFYQRPLKSKKSTIANCSYETRFYIKDGVKKEQPLKGIQKSHPLFQEFRLWQFLKNLKIYNDEQKDVTKDIFDTTEKWVDLFDYLNTLKEVEQKNIITYLVKNGLIEKSERNKYRWNYVEDKKYPSNETRASFISRLNKIENFDAKLFLTTEKEKELWHIIYSVKDKVEYKTALRTFALKNKIDDEKFVSLFEKYPPFKSAYGAYSEKALKKILPLMRMGKYWNEDEISSEIKSRIEEIKERLQIIDYKKEVFKDDKFNKLETIADDKIPKQLLKSFIEFKDKNHLEGLNTYQACYAVYERHSELSEIQHWETPLDIDKYLSEFKQHSLRNPIVEQVIAETLRVVKDIWMYYGKGAKNYFDEIHIELGREMKNPSDKRKRISARNQENENRNQRIKALLKELMNDGARPYSPSHQELLKIYEEGVLQNIDVNYYQISEEEIIKIRKKSSPTNSDIQRYKLWLEQGYISPYTGKMISLSNLFSADYQIEHIFPQSRYFDDSLSNKVICESDVNQDKSNKTAYEYIKEKGGSIVNGHLLLTLEKYKNHCKKYFRKNNNKLEKLLSEEIPENFINRQLNDSRYISKFVKSLLSNIVREENEREVTSKNLISVTGSITSRLKQNWGLNEVWNELVQSRFERLNELTKSNDFGYWDYQKDEFGNNIGKRFFRTQVPDDIQKGFKKKRIDYRHHSLDALVIACVNRRHIQYINSLNNEVEKRDLQPILLVKNKNGHFTQQFLKPWNNFTTNAKEHLEKIVISFKQNNRIINKTNNKTWQWVEKDGKLKKELVKQVKGKNWAIRKPLHKETVSGKLNWDASNGKIVTASRASLSEITNRKILNKITDSGIRKILENHLKNFIDDNGKESFELAFSFDGIDTLNKNIIKLNDGKFHQPIYKVRLFEEGKKFSVGESGNNKKKFVEAAKGTNLFFAIYWNEKKKKREFETIPLNEVIEHQKWRATLPKEEMKRTPMIPINKSKGEFLFSLSPNDLVYVPTEEEIEYPHNVDFSDLNRRKISRIYTVNDFSDNTIYFKPNTLATAITKKEVDLSFNKMKDKLVGSFDTKTASINGSPIKEICWKLKVDRLGNILKVEKGI